MIETETRSDLDVNIVFGEVDKWDVMGQNIETRMCKHMTCHKVNVSCSRWPGESVDESLERNTSVFDLEIDK